MRYLKIYGERNTGTNYLASLIARNLQIDLLPGVVPMRVARISARMDQVASAFGSEALRPGDRLKDVWFRGTFDSNLGWKHMLVAPHRLETSEVAHQTLFLALVKNPYSWALSLFKRPYHYYGDSAGTFNEFLNLPWRTVGRENAPRPFAGPIQMWNEKNHALVELSESYPTELVRYEDLLADPEGAVKKVQQRCGAARLRSPFQNIEVSTKKVPGKDYHYYRRFYLSEEWRAQLPSNVIESINGLLDHDLSAGLGYEMLDATQG